MQVEDLKLPLWWSLSTCKREVNICLCRGSSGSVFRSQNPVVNDRDLGNVADSSGTVGACARFPTCLAVGGQGDTPNYIAKQIIVGFVNPRICSRSSEPRSSCG
ncbi:unnamed protein product [Leptosia nina]|uniref:Uncharacterized protein n=1 Tax=Leptosia nina TaxID=320188 RepID=A0AAV1ISM1_9NEOP